MAERDISVSSERWILVHEAQTSAERFINIALAVSLAPSPYIGAKSATCIYYADLRQFMLVEETIDYLLGAPDVGAQFRKEFEDACKENAKEVEGSPEGNDYGEGEEQKDG